MDHSATPPEPESLAALHEQDARHFRAMFLGLADLGVEIVQVVAQRVKDEACAPAGAPSALPELVDAYDTMLRSLRRTALLVQKLTAPPPAPADRKPATRRDEDTRDRDAPLDLSKLSDAELDRLDRLDRLEDLESEDELAGRPLRAVIAAILRDFGVATLPGVEGDTSGTTAECAAPGTSGAAPVARAQRETGWARPEEQAGADALRRNGATGCRDP